MSAGKQKLDTCVADLWRISSVLRGDLEEPDAESDLELFDEALQALVGIVAARRRRLKLRSRLASPSPMRTPHIAASIDLGKGHNDCSPVEDPYSTDPVDWARAFLKSGDWRDEMRTYYWFYGAMHAANPDAEIAEDTSLDDVPTHPHGRPPSTPDDTTDD